MLPYIDQRETSTAVQTTCYDDSETSSIDTLLLRDINKTVREKF